MTKASRWPGQYWPRGMFQHTCLEQRANPSLRRRQQNRQKNLIETREQTNSFKEGEARLGLVNGKGKKY